MVYCPFQQHGRSDSVLDYFFTVSHDDDDNRSENKSKHTVHVTN